MVKIFADGADINSIKELSKNPLIQGFTTNPSLLRKSGVTNYFDFANEVLKNTPLPVSFEVLSDDFDEMYDQAVELSSWCENVVVKIPIVNTKGKSSEHLISALLLAGVKLNITAVMTYDQVDHIVSILRLAYGGYVSIFAGRIADTGLDPISVMQPVLGLLEYNHIDMEVIWASPREVLNIYQADSIGCHVITCTPELIKKYESLKDKDLDEYSRETVQMFVSDALNSGLKI